MPDALRDTLLIVLLILANGLFAAAEIALVSARRVRLEQRAEEGNAAAKTALELSNAPNRFLSTVQIGITLVGILSGALGGATLSEYLAPEIARIPFIEPAAEVIALVLVVLLITYFSLVMGELIPKRLALNNPEGIAMLAARPMNLLSRLTSPLVTFLGKSTDLGLRIIGVRLSEEPPITEEELIGLLEQGTRVGVFAEAEQDIVQSVFRFGDRRVDSVMTPRTEMAWLDMDAPLAETIQKAVESQYSLLPVSKGDLDNVQGILEVKDLLVAHLNDQPVDLRQLIKQPFFVPESIPMLRVLEEVRARGLTLAIVLDEYGGVLGMVTLIDILKALVGDIPTADDAFEPLVVRRPDGSWLIDGLMRVDELMELLDLDALPDQERVGYQTLGGMIMSLSGEIPTTGQSLQALGYQFEVVDMDGRRVDKVLVTPLAAPKNVSDDAAPGGAIA
ncbi:MAG: hemolysin family protein [Anaerolineaceae bacterium]|jgi:putative hemolysin